MKYLANLVVIIMLVPVAFAAVRQQPPQSEEEAPNTKADVEAIREMVRSILCHGAGSRLGFHPDLPRTGTKLRGREVEAEPLEEDGKGIFILKRKPDGSWVSTHCVWNSNIPLS